MPKVSASELEKAFSSLKTPEAKATIIYNLAKKTFKELQQKEKDDEEYEFPQEGIVSIAFPASLNDGVPQAVALAFKDENYRIGFSIAAQGGLLEQLVSQVEQIPIVRRIWGRELEIKEELPDSIKKLPGYKQPGKYETDKFWEVMDWARNINASLVEDVLVPSKRYLEAAHQFAKIGEESDAFILAEEHLEPEQIADLCEKAQTGFDIAIKVAREKGRKDLEATLKEKHIQSIEQGKHKEYSTNPARWEEVLSLAKEYHFGEEKLREIQHNALQSLTSAFEIELFEWRKKYGQMEEEKYNQRGSGRSWSNKEIDAKYRREMNITEARYSYIEKPAEAAAQVIDIIKMLPQEEAARTKEQLFKICNMSGFDGFGIAIALEDSQKALDYGIRLMHYFHDTSRSPNIRFAISAKLENKVLPKVDQEKRKEFIQSLNRLAENHGSWEDSRRVAHQYGLSEWLMGELEQKKPWVAAEVAIELGQKEKAKELYIKAEQYNKAIEQTDNSLEQAVLFFRIVEKRIEERVRFTSLRRSDDYNEEIGHMQKAIDLLKGVGVKEPIPEYVEMASKVITKLFSNGDYVEGCLFARDSGLTKEQYLRLINSEKVEEAEKRQDFAACYHLAKLQGRKDANGYKVLAEQFGQKVHRHLGDLVYKQPESRSRDKVADSDKF